MRNGLAARSGRDFRTYEGKPGEGRSREGKSRESKSRRTGRRESISGVATGFIARNPGFAFTFLAFVVAGAAITFNALSLQEARHPAPLFTSSEPGPSVALIAPPPPPAALVERPAPASQDAVPAQPTQPLSIADLAPPPPPSRPTRETQRPADPIAALIRGDGVASTTGSITAEPDLRLEAAQRALAGLGYGPLVVDGLDGPMTRDAIRRFERDQGLAPTGTLNTDTVRALAIRSGVALD